MQVRPSRWIGFVLALVATAVTAPALAQTVCLTPNCALAAFPPGCADRAAPRIPTVFMGLGASNVFDPPNPKIEPGECIEWRVANSTHNASATACPDVANCGSPSPAACLWDTANIVNGSAILAATCFYDPAIFPAGTGNGYYCRIHATPTTGTMRGTLMVTTEIKLEVDKDLGAGSVKLSWTGGGVAGDASYKVARQSGGDPAFPAATTATANPDGGVLGTTFTDAGDLANPTTRYYLVRNKQTNEP